MIVSLNKIVLLEAPPGVVILWEEKRKKKNLKYLNLQPLHLLGEFKLLGYRPIWVCVVFFQGDVEKVSISFRQERKAKIVMKWNSWSFANPDFRVLGKNFCSHREASRQRSAVSDRIRCYIYKIILWKTGTSHSPYRFAMMHPDRDPEASSAQGKAALDRSALGQEDVIIFSLISVGAASTRSPINLVLSNTARTTGYGSLVLSHTPTYTNTDIRQLTHRLPSNRCSLAS